MSRPLQIANGIFAAIFLVGAAVQLNDPDSRRWMAIYSCAAVACLIAYRLPRMVSVPAIVGVFSLGWAVLLAPGTVPEIELGNLVRKMETKTPQIEESRELLGLLIIGVWMVVLTWAAVRARRSGPPEGSLG